MDNRAILFIFTILKKTSNNSPTVFNGFYSQGSSYRSAPGQYNLNSKLCQLEEARVRNTPLSPAELLSSVFKGLPT